VESLGIQNLSPVLVQLQESPSAAVQRVLEQLQVVLQEMVLLVRPGSS
jgi:hypothetical protein